MTLSDVHGVLANAAIMFSLILGVWGLWRFFRREGFDSGYWGALVIGEALILIQGLLGAYLYFFAGKDLTRTIHILYGVVAAITIPSAFAFTRGRDTFREMLIYGVVLLFLAAILLRAKMTGG